MRSLSRIRLTAALLGLISSLPPYRRTLNPRKSKPSSRVTTRVLSSLNARPLGASQLASLALTSSASCLEWHRATRSSAYLISTGESAIVQPAALPVVCSEPRRPAPSRAGRRSTARADHTALRSSLLGAMQPTVLDHARLQPLRDHPPRGERAEHGQDVVVGDAVERPGQICVEHPPSLRALAARCAVDRVDRVMAAAAGPKPVGPRLEPGLPLGLQRVDDPCPSRRRERLRCTCTVAGSWRRPKLGEDPA